MIDKSKLLKGLFYIALIIILTTAASRLFFHSGETLSEYEKKNPPSENAKDTDEDTAEGTISNGNSDTNPAMDPGTDFATDSVTDTEAAMDAASGNRTDVSGNTLSDTDSRSGLSEAGISDASVEDSFYYMPLDDELTAYITGKSYPAATDPTPEISYADLRYVHILYVNFDGETTEGELICNEKIASDLLVIFYKLYLAEYQLERVELIDVYDADDDASMEANNTSCFNYRVVEGTDKLSKHAYGLAIDINPFYNPYVRYNKDGSLYIDPEGSETYADRSKTFPYKIDENDLCYRLFKEHGFTWGGDWNSLKDYQHFQKAAE